MVVDDVCVVELKRGVLCCHIDTAAVCVLDEELVMHVAGQGDIVEVNLGVLASHGYGAARGDVIIGRAGDETAVDRRRAVSVILPEAVVIRERA